MLSKNVEVRDFSMVLVAENANSTILNPGFLKYNRIVPDEWELAMPPICTPPVSQVIYKNGVNIVAQPDKISFGEFIDTEKIYKIPEISSKFVDVVPIINYQAIGINFNAYILAGEKEQEQDIILNKLIAAGKWKNFRGKSPNTLVQFVYQFEDSVFTIAIQEALMNNFPNNEQTPIIAFVANFHRQLIGTNPQEKTTHLKHIIQSYHSDLNIFISFIEEDFLVDFEE
jgi:hypothetical protein